MHRILTPGVALLLVIGCAGSLPPETARAIERYYQRHASEEGGRCPSLFIDGFTRVEIVEDTPERQVVDARYLYGDRIKDRDDEDSGRCIGFNRRQFTLAKSETGVEVVEMTGAKRR